MDKCDTCKYLESPCESCCASANYDYWEPSEEYETVNHPTHYTSGCGFECIEMMEMVFGKEAVFDYCILNAFKYIWRHKAKGGTEDIAKAEWYLEHSRTLNVLKNRSAIATMIDHITKLKGEATK